jgi:hypothetical protein
VPSAIDVPGRARSGRPGSSARPTALGLALAPLKSRALRYRQTRVAGKRGVPRGARAPQVGGASPCLVELRMPAGSAEPRLCAELQPHGIRRPVRHERQDMRPCRPRQCHRATATVAVHERPRLHQGRHARPAVRRGSRCAGAWFQARTDPVVRSRDDQGSRGCGDLNSGSVTGHRLAAELGIWSARAQSRTGWAVARWVMALRSAVPARRPGCWRACRLRVRLIGRTRLAVRPGRRSGGHCPPRCTSNGH